MKPEPRLNLSELSELDRLKWQDAIRGEWEYITDLLSEMADSFDREHDVSPHHLSELISLFRRQQTGVWSKCGNCGEISRPAAQEVKDWGIPPEWICWRCQFDNDLTKKKFKGAKVKVPKRDHHAAYHQGYRAGWDGTGEVELSPDSEYSGDEQAEQLFRVGYRQGARDRRQAERETLTGV